MDIRTAIKIVEAASAVNEAPLSDFGTFGDLDQEGSMRGDDLRAVRSEKWLSKVKGQFENFPYPLNVYVYNGEGGNVRIGDVTVNAKALEHLNKLSGIVPLATVQTMIGKMPPEAARSITAILIENEGNGRLPLTPWILAHRISHAVIDGAVSSGDTMSPEVAAAYARLNELFIELIRSTMSRLSATDEFESAFMGENPRNSENVSRVAKLIGTMRSARTGTLTNGGEFLVEMMAQVMTQGRVILTCPATPSDPRYGAKIAERLTAQAEALTQAVDDVFAACVGKAVLL